MYRYFTWVQYYNIHLNFVHSYRMQLILVILCITKLYITLILFVLRLSLLSKWVIINPSPTVTNKAADNKMLHRIICSFSTRCASRQPNWQRLPSWAPVMGIFVWRRRWWGGGGLFLGLANDDGGRVGWSHSCCRHQVGSFLFLHEHRVATETALLKEITYTLTDAGTLNIDCSY